MIDEPQVQAVCDQLLEMSEALTKAGLYQWAGIAFGGRAAVRGLMAMLLSGEWKEAGIEVVPPDSPPKTG